MRWPIPSDVVANKPMTPDELRRISDQARQERDKQKEDSKRYEEQQRAEEVALKWSHAKEALEKLDEVLANAAAQGATSVAVYTISGTYGYWAERRLGFWSREKERFFQVFSQGIPVYAQHVFDECQRRGLNPKWDGVPGYSHVGPGRLSIVISW